MTILKKILLMSLIFSILGNNTFANTTTTTQGVVVLSQGDLAPFTGYLFPTDKAILMKKELMELDELRALADSYQKSVDAYKANESLEQDKVSILLDQNGKLVDEVSKQKETTKWDERWSFVAGVVLTGLSVMLAERLMK